MVVPLQQNCLLSLSRFARSNLNSVPCVLAVLVSDMSRLDSGKAVEAAAELKLGEKACVLGVTGSRLSAARCRYRCRCFCCLCCNGRVADVSMLL